jgi:molecular chaperone GrpE
MSKKESKTKKTTNDEEILEELESEETTSEQVDDVVEAKIFEQLITPEEFEELQAELAEITEQTNEYLDGWQRARAEFANYKKRVERDQAQIFQSTKGNVVKDFLLIADDLERALKNRPQDGDGATWAEGIELVFRKLMNTFETEGVTLMDAEGQEFDPNLHEAISQEDNDEFDSGQIIEVIQPGYLLGDRILRPAKVRVAR